ncbi:MAG: aminoacyl-histidine dipeptidase [Epsilonproteobacteria bacterium]|nr:aminoacyl-histidine dipeptidase [Campylobacterota bacterium]
MVDKILEHFIRLTKIPHCSENSGELFQFLQNFGRERGYRVSTDSAENILIKSKNPKIALQAHYDMVCIGDAPDIEIIRDGKWLRAKNSSLGADNGMAIAMMMLLIDMGVECEFLFTSNEEIGLIGASNLELNLESSRLLNLDFEDEGRVCVGCAGGADIRASKRLIGAEPLKYIYRVEISGLEGGHSGIDIDKGIPNAIKLLAEFLKGRDIVLAEFIGGERINSIPTQASAIVSSNSQIEGSGNISVEPIDTSRPFYSGVEVINLIDELKSGVLLFNSSLNVVDRSINLALINMENGRLNIELSGRAMSDMGIDEVAREAIEILNSYGFETELEDKYPSWEPNIGDFAKRVYGEMKNLFGDSEFVAIHAGLECGVLSKKYPDMEIASIGPTIKSPHSKSERVDIESVEKSFNLILRLI